jgi:hypothetical protein
MKSIQAEYKKESKKISIKKGAEQEDWVSVCQRFNDDVTRISDVAEIKDYTGLFECFDDNNKSFFYLVKENKALFKKKRRHFLDNIGLD